MTTPFPAALVEALATVITDAVAECDNGPGLYPHEARQIATAALSALPAAVQAVARGEAVAVPVVATDAMIHAGASPDQGSYTKSRTAEFMGIWRRMLAASPYAQEPQR